ncbi:MAG: hypothetical protein GY944_06065 [bacterium]|nr:hypothetical protein [bacterium]
MPLRASRAIILTAAAMWLVLPSTGATEEINPAKAQREMLDAAVIDSFLESFGDDVFEGMLASSPDISDRDRSAFLRIVQAAFDADLLKARVGRRFAPLYAPEHSVKVLTWLRSPLQRRVQAAETAASAPARRDELQKFMETFDPAKLLPTRRKLLQRLDWVQQGSEFAATLTLNSILATAYGASGGKEQERGSEWATMRQRVWSQHAALAKEYRGVNLAANAFTYQDLTDEDLKGYISFSGTPAGKWYGESLQKAVKDTLQLSSQTVGRELAELQKQTPPPADTPNRAY